MTSSRDDECTVIAFDGINRCGKGTQISLLEDSLKKASIPYLTLRGEGSREGLGLEPGDPYSEWWQNFRKRLSAPNDSRVYDSSWKAASERLAIEFLEWKRKSANNSILILDRSLISKMAPLIYSREYRGLGYLYESVNIQEMVPDILIHLNVPQSVLISRLDTQDKKYDFRKSIIDHKYESYKDALSLLMTELPSVIKNIDGVKQSDLIAKEVREILLKLQYIDLPRPLNYN